MGDSDGELQHTEKHMKKRAGTVLNMDSQAIGFGSAFYSLYGLVETAKSIQNSVSLFVKIKVITFTLFGFWKQSNKICKSHNP